MSSDAVPQPSSRVARKRERARKHLVEAAREVVRREGFERLTIEAVAAEADVSKPAVYYYFASKEELARALAIARSAEEVATVRAAVEALPAGQPVVAAVVRAYVAHHRQSMHLFRAEYVWGQVIGFDAEEIDSSVNQRMIGLFDLIEQRLAADGERGLLHAGLPLRRIAFTTWTAAHGLIATLSVIESGQSQVLHDVDDLVDTLCSMLTRGVYRAAADTKPRKKAREAAVPRGRR